MSINNNIILHIGDCKTFKETYTNSMCLNLWLDGLHPTYKTIKDYARFAVMNNPDVIRAYLGTSH